VVRVGSEEGFLHSGPAYYAGSSVEMTAKEWTASEGGPSRLRVNVKPPLRADVRHSWVTVLFGL
jgi:hypothetical protein